VRTAILAADNRADLERAVELLKGGAIVAVPTETVYGLAVRADLPEAVAELERLKRRPPGKKFALLVASQAQAATYGRLCPSARRLAAAFWPGPLTLVVPDGAGGEVGLRCPDCEPTRTVVRLVGAPVLATSANLSGEVAAQTAEAVRRAFEGRIAAVLDGGPARLGRASTVIRVAGGGVEVLRPGAIEEWRLRRVLEAES